jgi:sugar lactone lactonase YvrE
MTLCARIDADPDVVHLGDGKCDPQGRLWLGTQPNDFTPGHCAFYRADPDGTVTTLLEGVGLSNGLDWSPDGATLYYIDSFTRSVDAFDFDARRGTIGGRRSIVKIGIGKGGFDGMTVDREGCLWVAVFGPGEVHRYSPKGELLARVQISAPAATSCAFGGADGGDLVITSASIRLPPGVVSLIGCSPETAETSATAPGAGGLFVCRPGATGKPATPFAG